MSTVYWIYYKLKILKNLRILCSIGGAYFKVGPRMVEIGKKPKGKNSCVSVPLLGQS